VVDVTKNFPMSDNELSILQELFYAEREESRLEGDAMALFRRVLIARGMSAEKAEAMPG